MLENIEFLIVDIELIGGVGGCGQKGFALGLTCYCFGEGLDPAVKVL